MRVSFKEAVQRGWFKPEDVPKGAQQYKQVFSKAVAAGPTPVSPQTPPRARNREREGEEQAQLMDEVDLRFPEIAHLLIHIPNGGTRKNRYEGWRLKRQGVRKGVSDLLLPTARGGYFGLWIEFKAAPPFDAAVSDSQEEWQEFMRNEGYCARVCRGVDEALAALGEYLAMPRTKVLV